MNRRALFLTSSLIALGVAVATPALAQQADGALPPAETEAPADEQAIVVTAQRLRGEVATDVAPELQLNEADVASYGASTIGDLLAALEPQTGGARGRGGGRPVVLLNGRRISGFGELRSIPSEAIQRVDILPEQVALQFGYAADQRVVNFILKPNYAAVTIEAEFGAPTDGGRFEQEYEGSLVNLTPDARYNLSVEYQRQSAITQAERGIVETPRTDDGTDQTPFRTLAAASRQFTLEGTANRFFSDTLSGTLNAKLDIGRSDPSIGLADASLILADGSGFSRAFPEFGALGRRSATTSGHLGGLIDGELGKFRWSLTGNYDLVDSDTRTDRGIDPAIAQAYVDAGGDLASDFPVAALVARAPDSAESRSRTFEGLANLSGPVFETAAGAATVSLAAGAQRFTIDSRSVRSGAVATADLERGQRTVQGSVDIPLARDGEGVLGFARSVSVNANLAYRDLSDFGGLTTYGYGLNLSPVEGVQFTASTTTEEGAPSLSQLGNPVIVTPDSLVFDFASNTTVLIPTIGGGNPALRADRRNVVDLGINIRPKKPDGLSFVANYVRTRSRDPISSFPTLSPEIEAAFPDRIVRDANGRLVSVDLRPVNFQREESDRVRFGINYSSGGRGRGRGGGFGRRGGGGRDGAEGPPTLNYRLSLYDTVYLKDRVVIRDGLPVLDLLNGSATGSGGGRSRHTLSANAGVFYDGFGGFLNLDYASPTSVNGGRAGATALDFGSTFNLNLRMFVNFDQQEELVARLPWLKHSRIRLGIDNLTGSIQQVRDESGAVPLRYQPGFVDPVGRSVEISFRKQF